jgi:hypothetical protein
MVQLVEVYNIRITILMYEILQFHLLVTLCRNHEPKKVGFLLWLGGPSMLIQRLSWRAVEI